MKLLLSLLLLFAGFLPVSAQSLPEDPEKLVDQYVRTHNERRAKNPEGLLFTVRLKDTRKHFHLGEVITLELSFAASKPNTFTLDAATYDRSGRLHSDGFILDPRDGAIDPLTDFFNSGLHGFMLGGHCVQDENTRRGIQVGRSVPANQKLSGATRIEPGARTGKIGGVYKALKCE